MLKSALNSLRFMPTTSLRREPVNSSNFKIDRKIALSLSQAARTSDLIGVQGAISRSRWGRLVKPDGGIRPQSSLLDEPAEQAGQRREHQPASCSVCSCAEPNRHALTYYFLYEVVNIVAGDVSDRLVTPAIGQASRDRLERTVSIQPRPSSRALSCQRRVLLLACCSMKSIAACAKVLATFALTSSLARRLSAAGSWPNSRWRCTSAARLRPPTG